MAEVAVAGNTEGAAQEVITEPVATEAAVEKGTDLYPFGILGIFFSDEIPDWESVGSLLGHIISFFAPLIFFRLKSRLRAWLTIAAGAFALWYIWQLMWWGSPRYGGVLAFCGWITLLLVSLSELMLHWKRSDPA